MIFDRHVLKGFDRRLGWAIVSAWNILWTWFYTRIWFFPQGINNIEILFGASLAVPIVIVTVCAARQETKDGR